MTLDQIKEAVRSGKTVCEGTPAYEVRLHTFKDGTEQWLIKCIHNNYCIDLTWADGVTLNESNFFIRAPQSTEIEVHVRGGVAYCEDERVKIIDHDNFEDQETEREPIKVTWPNSLDILKQIQAAKAEAEDGSPTECVNLLEIIEHKLINGEVKS